MKLPKKSSFQTSTSCPRGSKTSRSKPRCSSNASCRTLNGSTMTICMMQYPEQDAFPNFLKWPGKQIEQEVLVSQLQHDVQLPLSLSSMRQRADWGRRAASRVSNQNFTLTSCSYLLAHTAGSFRKHIKCTPCMHAICIDTAILAMRMKSKVIKLLAQVDSSLSAPAPVPLRAPLQ